MKAKEWETLKKGDLIYHKHFGLCEVIDFVMWIDPVIMPQTDEGKVKLYRFSGMKDTPMIETSKRLINKKPFNNGNGGNNIDMKALKGKAVYTPSGKAGSSRSELPDNCVDRDYNMFNNK